MLGEIVCTSSNSRPDPYRWWIGTPARGNPDGERRRSDAGSSLTPLSGQKSPRRPENWPIRIVRCFAIGPDFACKMLPSLPGPRASWPKSWPKSIASASPNPSPTTELTISI